MVPVSMPVCLCADISLFFILFFHSVVDHEKRISLKSGFSSRSQEFECEKFEHVLSVILILIPILIRIQILILKILSIRYGIIYNRIIYVSLEDNIFLFT